MLKITNHHISFFCQNRCEYFNERLYFSKKTLNSQNPNKDIEIPGPQPPVNY